MATKSRIDADLEIVDTDIHVTDRERNILPYLDSPYDKLLGPTLDGIEDDYPNAGIYPQTGFVYPPNVGKTERREVSSPDDLHDVQELLGADRLILTPGLNLNINAVHHADLAHGLAVAFNEWVLDTFLDDVDAAYGLILVTSQRPEKAAAEIENRAGESKMVGVMLPSASVPPMGHDWYAPIYEAAEAHGLPIVSHIAGMSLLVNFPRQWIWTDRYVDHKVPYTAAEYMFHLSNILTKGVPVKYPDLEFVIMETGLGWVPYFLERYDHVYHGNQHDAPMLEKTPSEYIHDNFYFTSQPIEGMTNPEYLTGVLRAMRAGQNLMFASDYPHHDFDHTSELYSVLGKEFSRKEIENIYGQTALDVFDF